MNFEEVPSITPAELAEWMKTRPELVLLDVREPFEVLQVRLPDPRVVYAPLSRLAASEDPELPPAVQNRAANIVVFCHHGIRSVQVAWWLREIGWTNVFNLLGGLEAYASEVDASIGFY